ncbi:hypothetical protein SAMN04488543_2933 [Friedmanniella luteola]|uniref:SPFH domain / Band 7 family protein n=1 Tax=Friedmanniella luteola TaxID=546871 RepID=A0A1H1X861_9ACTN|nr:hypothetical protein [Friedmanniella luteola]SDT05261.1 hypothetical protein SAMN04488543_2933 [Friedmanniella luteola]
MDDDRGNALLRWWARRAQDRAAREPGRAPGAPSSTGASPAPQPSLGHRLVGALVPLTRLAVVGRGTVAVVLAPDGRAVVRRPGELLVPRLLVRPGAPALRVLPVSTDLLHLDVPLAGLVSFDGYPVDPVTLRLELQLDAADEYAALAALVAEHGAAVEAVLLDPVPRACAAAAQGAVAMNRLAQLQRLGLREVLAERWLPLTFSGGLLLRRGFDVVERDGEGGQDEPTVPVLGRHPVTTPAPSP